MFWVCLTKPEFLSLTKKKTHSVGKKTLRCSVGTWDLRPERHSSSFPLEKMLQLNEKAIKIKKFYKFCQRKQAFIFSLACIFKTVKFCVLLQFWNETWGLKTKLFSTVKQWKCKRRRTNQWFQHHLSEKKRFFARYLGKS